MGQAKFMEWDELMGADGKANETACKAKTSNLNEDLGRIQHIFRSILTTYVLDSLPAMPNSFHRDMAGSKNILSQ